MAAATLMTLLLSASAGSASHEVDQGWVNGGVSSEEEARAYPCPTDAAGGWERTGPVVCLEKRTDEWQVEAEIEGSGCTYDATGWHGDCVFDLDAGDHVRVWGTRGIVWTKFEVTWHHDGNAPDPEPAPSHDGGDSETGEPGEGAGPGGPGGPGGPNRPGSPAGPPAPPPPPAPPAEPQQSGDPSHGGQPDAPSGTAAPDSSESPSNAPGTMAPSANPSATDHGTQALVDPATAPSDASGLPLGVAGLLAVAVAVAGGWFFARRAS